MKKPALLAVLLSLAMASPAEAAFPGANGRVAFLDILGRITLTNLPGGRDVVTDGRDYDPTWSPDGKRLAFSHEVFAYGGQISVVNADGSGLTRLTPRPSRNDRIDQHPSWSPDGKKLVYESYREVDGVSNADLYVINDDGTGEVRLTSDAAYDQTPAWSPDGHTIAFASNRGEIGSSGYRSNDIYLMNAGGGEATRLTDGRNTYPWTDFNYEPNWSPDGKRLTFTRTSCDLSSPGSCSSDILVIDADGSNEQRLTTNPLNDSGPAWAPDGSRIIFQGDVPTDIWGPKPDLFSINPDGTRLIRHTYTVYQDGVEEDPEWQPLSRLPVCTSAAAEPATLLPANRRFVSVQIAGVTDPDGDALAITFTGVTQDEPVTEQGGGDPTRPDARRTAGGLQLRAERNPQRDGRAYHVQFTAADGRGGSCSGEVTVSVPRTQGRPAVDSAPPSYDSFGQ
jgi:TolB protein